MRAQPAIVNTWNLPWRGCGCPGRAAGGRDGLAGSGWGSAFSPALTYASSASVTGWVALRGKALLQQRLDSMPAGQQGAPIAVQFVGQMLGGHTLADTAQDLQPHTGAVAALLEEGAGEDVEDIAPAAAAVIVDRSAMAARGAWSGGKECPLGQLAQHGAAARTGNRSNVVHRVVR